jgi:hypothetical protein
MKKKILGVDLDETLINNQYNYENKEKFNIKNAVYIYLPLIYQKYDLHLITARNDENSTKKIVDHIQRSVKVEFSTITCTNGERKGNFAAQLGCEFLIDDCPDFLSNCLENQVRPILLTNKKRKHERLFKDYKVCSNWKEIYEFLTSQ